MGGNSFQEGLLHHILGQAEQPVLPQITLAGPWVTFAFFPSSGNSPDPHCRSVTEPAFGETSPRGAKAAPAE